jgi:hypothetical protein
MDTSAGPRTVAPGRFSDACPSPPVPPEIWARLCAWGAARPTGEEARRKVPPWGRGLRPADRPAPARSLGREVEVSVIDVPTVFRDFEDYWSPSWAARRTRRATQCRWAERGVRRFASAFGPACRPTRRGSTTAPPALGRYGASAKYAPYRPERTSGRYLPARGKGTRGRWSGGWFVNGRSSANHCDAALPRTLPLRTRVNRARGTFESPMFRIRGRSRRQGLSVVCTDNTLSYHTKRHKPVQQHNAKQETPAVGKAKAKIRIKKRQCSFISPGSNAKTKRQRTTGPRRHLGSADGGKVVKRNLLEDTIRVLYINIFEAEWSRARADDDLEGRRGAEAGAQ